MVKRLFLAVPWGCLRYVIVVFPDHTHLLFLLGYIHFNVVNSGYPDQTPFYVMSEPSCHVLALPFLTVNLIETPFNTFANSSKSCLIMVYSVCL